MAAADEEVLLGQVRRAHPLVAVPVLHLLGQPLELADDRGAGGLPQRQAGPHLLVEGEDLQLLAELAVVAQLRLLEQVEVALELLLVAPGGAIDALQHRLVLVAPPVGAGDRQQLESLARHLAGVLDVRPLAQVLEGVLAIGSDRHRLVELVAHLVDLPLAQAGDQLLLVGLVGEQRGGLLAAHLAELERVLAADDAAHALLDLLEVLRRKGARLAGLLAAEVEVVVEAGRGRRADGELGLGIELEHRLRHDVGGGVADLVQVVLRQLARLGHGGLRGYGEWVSPGGCDGRRAAAGPPGRTPRS